MKKWLKLETIERGQWTFLCIAVCILALCWYSWPIVAIVALAVIAIGLIYRSRAAFKAPDVRQVSIYLPILTMICLSAMSAYSYAERNELFYGAFKDPPAKINPVQVYAKTQADWDAKLEELVTRKVADSLVVSQAYKAAIAAELGASTANQAITELTEAVSELDESVRALGVESVMTDGRAKMLTERFDAHVNGNEGSFTAAADGIRSLKEKMELLEAEGSPVARILKGVQSEGEPKSPKPPVEYVTPSVIAQVPPKKAPVFPPLVARDPNRPTHVRCTCKKDHEITSAVFNTKTGQYDMIWQDDGRCLHEDKTLCKSTGFVWKK